MHEACTQQHQHQHHLIVPTCGRLMQRASTRISTPTAIPRLPNLVAGEPHRLGFQGIHWVRSDHFRRCACRRLAGPEKMILHNDSHSAGGERPILQESSFVPDRQQRLRVCNPPSWLDAKVQPHHHMHSCHLKVIWPRKSSLLICFLNASSETLHPGLAKAHRKHAPLEPWFSAQIQTA